LKSRARTRSPFAAAAAGVCALCLLLPALAGSAPDTRKIPDSGDITLGYMESTFFGMETEEARNIVQYWTDRAHKSNYPGAAAHVEIFRDIAGMEKALREGKIDIVSTVSDDFVRLRKRAPLLPIMLSGYRGGIHQKMVVVVRRDRGIREWKDLKDKQIVIAGEKVHSIHLTWLETLLMREGYRTPRDFFSSVKEIDQPSQAILSVFFRRSDACLTSLRSFDLAVELNPQVGMEMFAIAKSPDMATGVISVRSDFDPGDKEKLIEAFRSMDGNPAGKQLLQLFRVDHFVPFREEYLESVKKMVREHDLLSAKMTTARRQ